MDRRTFIGQSGGLAFLSQFAGCSSFLGSDGVDLLVRNKGSEVHAYTVEDTERDSRTTSEELAPDESDTKRNFLPREDYQYPATISVALDGTHVHESDIQIPHDVSRIKVVIRDSQSVEIWPNDVYSPTPPER